MHPNRVRVLAVAVAALALLSGCSGEGVGGAVNGVVTEASGGDVSLGGQLPDGWPADIPVIEGDLGFGAANSTDGGRGWVVTVTTDAADPLSDATTVLEAAGFSADTANIGDAGVAALTNETWSVVIAGTPEGVLYTVSPVA
ncbi:MULTISPECIES: hypothetical protein [Cryobacterium]|uniref:Secreted protein n=1 Tax=Cryobacterium breve TaxID=1259258 RepID=A0ABY2J3H2_9MICO|nr:MULTISPECIES: hypothetical protein [Cryobacterium]TFC91025.1 hypothetical protein E3T20_15510 [Cryobacterium sp. TmT3-12]TFC99344.1 hypothetical protein E3O65_06645 [Cryobacterium breve]